LSPTIDLASLIIKGEYKSDDIRFSSKNLSTLSENELLHLMELAISIENGDLVGRLLYTVSYTALP
jgi:hypothetical protein